VTAEYRRWSGRAADLALAFDIGFAREPRTDRAASDALLGFGAGGDAYAVRLREITGLFNDRRVLLLPSPVPEFLGVAGIRGGIVPVYDLPALLGCPPATNRRWLLLAAAAEPLGLAFDSFEGQLFAPQEDMVVTGSDGARPHVTRAVRIRDRLRYVVDIASVVAVVSRRAEPRPPQRSADHGT
jgi:purine-binding chemotaxis protein CheW